MDAETEKLWKLMEGRGCSYRDILTMSEIFSFDRTGMAEDNILLIFMSSLHRHVSLIAHKLCSFFWCVSSHLTPLLVGALESVKNTFPRISYLFWKIPKHLV